MYTYLFHLRNFSDELVPRAVYAVSDLPGVSAAAHKVGDRYEAIVLAERPEPEVHALLQDALAPFGVEVDRKPLTRTRLIRGG